MSRVFAMRKHVGWLAAPGQPGGPLGKEALRKETVGLAVLLNQDPCPLPLVLQIINLGLQRRIQKMENMGKL